jgi:hypothetical protein
MAEAEPVTAQVVRVTRPDTIHLRAMCPTLQSMISCHMTIHGCVCEEGAQQAICDWVEVHADHGRINLSTVGWMRDEYGRILGDLCDMQSGECLSSYLLEQKVASPRPHHYMETLLALMHSKEPEEC